MNALSPKEKLSDLFWKMILPIFRFKWWIRDRGERKIIKERQSVEYLLYGYKCCIWYRDYHETAFSEEVDFCTYEWKHGPFLMNRHPWRCKKSKDCKNYMYDPMKG